MSSELVLYVLSACRRPAREILLSYNCAAPAAIGDVRLVVCFEDGETAEGRGQTIFGALHDLMLASKGMPDYFGSWAALG